MRNLDLTALRSLVAVADLAGVTKAAGFLHLTQSAVSMQIKRLEESLNVQVLDRTARQITPTPEGEQLISYARRMLTLNDEALLRLTAQDYEGELTLGVPHDIIHPYIPPVLRRFAQEFPRMRINLISAPTLSLREMFARGRCDAILTTEGQPGEGGEPLVTLPLVWLGAEGGTAWRQRPLPIAYSANCILRPMVIRRLDEAGMDWRMVVDTQHDSAVTALISADLAVHAAVKGDHIPATAPIPGEANLPDPGEIQIGFYMQDREAPARAALCAMIRESYLSNGLQLSSASVAA